MRLVDADKLYPDCMTKDGKLAISQSQLADASTVENITVFCENADEKTIDDLNAELERVKTELRPQGRWIPGGKDVTGQYFLDEFICNQCFTIVTDKSNFCPKCGAKMLNGDVK